MFLNDEVMKKIIDKIGIEKANQVTIHPVSGSLRGLTWAGLDIGFALLSGEGEEQEIDFNDHAVSRINRFV